MKWIAISFLQGFVVLFCSGNMLIAQFKKPIYHEVYPELPFSTEDVIANKYNLIIVWYDEFKKSKDDEPGMIWSDKVVDYQLQRHNMVENKISKSTWYTPGDKKIKMLEYFYRGKNLSVIDEYVYDSLQEPQLLHNYIYTFRDTIPFQMVKMYTTDKQFRLLYDYTFDEKGKLKRQQVTTHGVAKKLETVMKAEEDIMMILVDHKNDMSIYRYYKNMSELQKSVKTTVNEKGQCYETNIRDGTNKVVNTIKYQYEADRLSMETYSKFNGNQVVADKIIYYRYNDEGLLEKIITEKDNVQSILTLQYYRQ